MSESYIRATIANGASLSGALPVGPNWTTAGRVLGLIVGTWTSGAITFQVSHDGTTYYDLYDKDGAEVTIPAATHNRAYAIPLEVLGFPYLKVRSGTSASPVTQSGGDDVIVVLG